MNNINDSLRQPERRDGFSGFGEGIGSPFVNRNEQPFRMQNNNQQWRREEPTNSSFGRGQQPHERSDDNNKELEHQSVGIRELPFAKESMANKGESWKQPEFDPWKT